MRRTIAILAVLAVAACTETIKTPVAVGGSRADASVEMAYQQNTFEIVTPDWNAAGIAAARRCQAWGYSRADAFEGTRSSCTRYDGFGGCAQMTHSRTYQCLG